MRDVIKMFRKHAKSIIAVDNIIDAILIKSTIEENLYGFLWVSEDDERLDNHCNQCMDELPLGVKFGKHGNFPAHLSYGAGHTKYAKIVAGTMRISGVEIIGSLLDGSL